MTDTSSRTSNGQEHKENDKNKSNESLLQNGTRQETKSDPPQNDVPLIQKPALVLANEIICLPLQLSPIEPSEHAQLSGLYLDHCYSNEMEIDFDSIEGFYSPYAVMDDEGEFKNRY